MLIIMNMHNVMNVLMDALNVSIIYQMNLKIKYVHPVLIFGVKIFEFQQIMDLNVHIVIMDVLDAVYFIFRIAMKIIMK